MIYLHTRILASFSYFCMKKIGQLISIASHPLITESQKEKIADLKSQLLVVEKKRIKLQIENESLQKQMEEANRQKDLQKRRQLSEIYTNKKSQNAVKRKVQDGNWKAQLEVFWNKL